MRLLCILSGLAISEDKWDNPYFSREQALQDILQGKNHLNKIFEGHQVEFYCHVWGNKSSEFISNNYNPMTLICENQENFQEFIRECYYQKFVSMPKMNYPGYTPNSIFNIDESWAYFSRIYSQLHSRSVIAHYLLDSHPERIDLNNYDFIILTRYDISSRGGIHVSQIPTINAISKIDKTHNNKALYLPTFNQLNDGYPDMWFISNNSYFLKNISNQKILWRDSILSESEYFYLREEGWPLSEAFDLQNIRDIRQYSNKQINKGALNNRLMKYPRSHNLNIHAFVKYSFWIDSSLFQQIRFLDIESMLVNST
jgi:hypothetical protein